MGGNYGDVVFDNTNIFNRNSWADGVIYKNAPGESPVLFQEYVSFIHPEFSPVVIFSQ